MYRNILIATDGSELANRAVSQGLALAQAMGAVVTAVTVTDFFSTASGVLMPSAGDVQRYESAAAKAAKDILARVEASARDMRVECRTLHIVDELPAEGILKACREGSCDLIVLATHGRRGIDRVLLGSQSMKVMTLGTVPVLICR